MNRPAVVAFDELVAGNFALDNKQGCFKISGLFVQIDLAHALHPGIRR